jgi:hypothetical protein
VTQAGAGITGGELPVDRPDGGIAPDGPRRDFPFHCHAIGDALAQALALALAHAQLRFGHGQPGPMLRRVVDLQFVGQAFGFSRREGGIQRGGGWIFS